MKTLFKPPSIKMGEQSLGLVSREMTLWRRQEPKFQAQEPITHKIPSVEAVLPRQWVGKLENF